MVTRQAEKLKETRFFEKFMQVMEVVYAVLLSWGFANVAQDFRSEWAYCLPTVIAGLVLIRFFFAPAHNLYHIAIESRERGYWQQLLIFVFDIPMLILHSFIYYRMCFHVGEQDYLFFYYLFVLLLLFNVIWLALIEVRLFAYEKKIAHKHYFWIYNNAFHLGLFAVIFILRKLTGIDLIHLPYYWVLFLIALSNCGVDFLLSAPFYLGFKEE